MQKIHAQGCKMVTKTIGMMTLNVTRVTQSLDWIRWFIMTNVDYVAADGCNTFSMTERSNGFYLVLNKITKITYKTT